jgi:hypothetical protein
MSSFDDKWELVQAFFEKHVLDYIVKDLNVLHSIPVPPSGGGACSAPLAMAVFSAMDLLGGLTGARTAKKYEDQTWFNISHFLGKWMSRSNALYGDQQVQEVLSHMVRRGAAHRFFPLGTAIKRDLDCNCPLKTGTSSLQLNPQAFALDFLNAIEAITKKIRDGDHYRNRNFVMVFHDRLVAQLEENVEDMKHYLVQLRTKAEIPPAFDDDDPTLTGTLDRRIVARRDSPLADSVITTVAGESPEYVTSVTLPPEALMEKNRKPNNED